MKVDVPTSVWLLLGVVLMAGAHMTFSIGALAWIAYAPFLIFLHLTDGWASRLWFFLAYALAWSIVVCKIITDPIPLLVVPMYAIPIALFHLPAFLVWSRWRNHVYAGFLFPSLMVMVEWFQYTFTPLGSWGAAAYTQMDQLIILQSVSLFGLAGLGFLIYWVNMTVFQWFTSRKNVLRLMRWPIVVLGALLVFGELRYDLAMASAKKTIKVAAVGTDSQVGVGPLPADSVRRKNAITLFNRTRSLANSGTQLVVWNEGAAMVLPEEESLWKDSLSSLAFTAQTRLVASYVLLVSGDPVLYENKYLYIEPDGQVVSEYHKREPVPGEPARKGEDVARVHKIEATRIGGAICYDYDFPYISRDLGKEQVDVVALPSSDWRGIDPIHTKMAAFRAVEQGHAILRSTRFGLSAAISPFGELVAQMSSFDENDRVMLAHLPSERVWTLYGHIGNVFIYACVGFVLFFTVKVIRKG